jgi:ABC-2 type transport system permease protein
LASVALPEPHSWPQYPRRVGTFCLVELQKLSHDRTEAVTRAVQPVLWLVIFGETFNRLHTIPTGDISYLDFLVPGIIAQSSMFVAIFYGIQIIWERDAGVLRKLLVTPTPRSALIIGKAFSAGIRAMIQVVVVLAVATLLGVSLQLGPFDVLGCLAVVLMGSAFFACPLDDDRRPRAPPGAADGDRADDHDAALLRLERALPRLRHAGLAEGSGPRESALVRGGCTPRPPDRDAPPPAARLRRPLGRSHDGHRGRLVARRAARAVAQASDAICSRIRSM